ncbi:unnamed protein product [Calypogeia fissa]
MDGQGAAKGTLSMQLSPARGPASRPFTTVGVGKGSVPTSPTYSKQAWPSLKKKPGADSAPAPYMAYATPGSGAVDLWKKLARKAELELNLEVDCHRADNAKNNATIHRISRRLIPLEKAYGKAKEALKHQEKVISFLKGKLMAVDERKNMEISYLRSQIETFQKSMVGAAQTNEQKILELQEELHQADSRAGTLQAQITEIYRNVDDEPDTMDVSSTRTGTPASPKDGIMDIKKNVQRQNKQNIGLGAVAKIHKMRLSKQYIKEKLKESGEEIALLVQENDRLRKLAQDAVGRSKKFLDLAQTLKADRDLTMCRLKETEDIIKSLEALKDLVDLYLKTLSPRLGNFIPGPRLNKQLQKRQEAPQSKRNTDESLQLEATGLATMKAGVHARLLYSQDEVGAGAQSIGESLVRKLQDVFQVLAYKVETANQTAKTVKKAGEKIRLTMLEAFQELRGQKGSKLNTADDVALGVLIAVRDVKHTLEELEKEKALLKASESVEDEKLMLLESQVHELSMDKLALLEFLESVKSTIRAANAGQGVIPYMKGFFDRPVIRGGNVYEVMDMIGKLVTERNEARSMGGGLMEDKLLKEKDLSDLRKLYAQSQTLTTHLQVEKDHLKKERTELKAICEDLKRQKSSWDAEKKGEYDKMILELKSQIHDLILDRAALLETLDAIKNALASPKTGSRDMKYVKGFLKRSVVQGSNVSDVMEIVDEMVAEREAANLKESNLTEERKLKERELDETKKFLAQSQSESVILEEEKNSLYSKLSELKQNTHALRLERESINASSVEMEKKISALQSQHLDLTQERNACRKTLTTLTNTFRAATSSAATEHSEDFLHGSSESESGSVLLAMAEKLVKERNEARSGGRVYVEELETKEKQMSHLRHLYAESKSLSEILQNDKNELEKQVNKLQNTFRTIRRSISDDVNPGLEPADRSPLTSGDVAFENMVSEVLEIKEKLRVANSELERDRRLFERIFQGTKSTDSKEGRPPSDWESEASVLISSWKVLQAEMSDLRHLSTGSKSLSKTLQNDKDELEKEVKKLRSAFRTLRRSISEDSSSLDLETSDRSILTAADVTFDNTVSEVLVIKEKLSAANSELQRGRKVFERIFQETKSLVSQEGHPPSDLESEASLLISSLKVLHAEKQQIAAVVTSCSELHSVLKKELDKLFKTMISSETDPRSPMESSSELTAQDHVKTDSIFRKMVNSLPSVVEEVEKLKRRQLKLEGELQSLVVEKEDSIRKNSQHLDKLLKLSDCSQQEVDKLRDELSTVRSLVSSVSLGRTLTFKATSSKQDVKQNALIMELEGLIKEVVALRTDKADLEVVVGDLRSKGGSEQEKLQDFGIKLSSAEALVQTLSLGAVAAESKIKSLESQLAGAEAQLSELFVTISSKERVPSSAGRSSSSELQTVGMDIGAIIKALQNRVFELLVAKDEDFSKRGKEVSKWKGQQDALERDFKLSTAEMERLRAKSIGQEEFIKTHTAEWAILVENLKKEIARLGGADPKDEGEKLRKSLAMDKTKELLLPALTRSPSTSAPQSSTDASPSGNPLLSLGTFQVDLLVNNKVHSQLKVSGHNGGLCQAALHYFNVDARTGEVTFENAMVPGSQSSNLVLDLFLQPVDSKRGYQTQAGDILGLRVKLSTYSDPSSREVLNSTSIIRTDEVLEAIQGQMIQNFSLWPDIVSSWRWERDAKKTRWSLMSVRWRFLLKNIFPELSAPFQDLTIKGSNAPRSSSIHIS